MRGKKIVFYTVLHILFCILNFSLERRLYPFSVLVQSVNWIVCCHWLKSCSQGSHAPEEPGPSQVCQWPSEWLVAHQMIIIDLFLLSYLVNTVVVHNVILCRSIYLLSSLSILVVLLGFCTLFLWFLCGGVNDKKLASFLLL